MNTHRVDKIIQYALAVAGQQEFGSNELGPIHFVKYVYIADLEYAKSHEGETYTGTHWIFYNFGPWSQEVYGRIDPALASIGAEKKEIPSQYENDFLRWKCSDTDLADELEKELDFLVSINVKNSVIRYAADTYSLLHYVYKTIPMLKAAPNEQLIFEGAIREEKVAVVKKEKPLTAKQKKRISQKSERLRSFVAQQLAKKNAKPQSTQPEPRYDDVFFAGQEMLNKLAGESIKEESFVCEIADDVWKSKSRYDPDLPS